MKSVIGVIALLTGVAIADRFGQGSNLFSLALVAGTLLAFWSLLAIASRIGLLHKLVPRDAEAPDTL